MTIIGDPSLPVWLSIDTTASCWIALPCSTGFMQAHGCPSVMHLVRFATSRAEKVDATILLPGTSAAPAATAVVATSRACDGAVPDTMIAVSPALAVEAARES